MRIVAISDTHERTGVAELESLPEGDVLVHAGDFTGVGHPLAIVEFNKWLGEQKSKFKHIVVIPGNHDLLFEDTNFKDYARQLMTNCTFLIDESVVIDGVKFYGSPWQPKFFDWAFNLPRGVPLREKWRMIPDDTNVLITHGPPYGILDHTERGEMVGCEDLTNRINELKQLKLHVFGHIHNAYGQWSNGRTTFVNAATCTETYYPENPPIVVDI